MSAECLHPVTVLYYVRYHISRHRRHIQFLPGGSILGSSPWEATYSSDTFRLHKSLLQQQNLVLFSAFGGFLLATHELWWQSCLPDTSQHPGNTTRKDEPSAFLHISRLPSPDTGHWYITASWKHNKKGWGTCVLANITATKSWYRSLILPSIMETQEQMRHLCSCTYHGYQVTIQVTHLTSSRDVPSSNIIHSTNFCFFADCASQNNLSN